MRTVQSVWQDTIDVVSVLFNLRDDSPPEAEIPPAYIPENIIEPMLQEAPGAIASEVSRIVFFWEEVLHNREDYENFYSLHRNSDKYELFQSALKLTNAQIDIFANSLERILLKEASLGITDIDLHVDYKDISSELQQALGEAIPEYRTSGLYRYLPNKTEMSLKDGNAFGRLGYDSPYGDPADILDVFNAKTPGTLGHEAEAGAQYIIRLIEDRDRLDRSAKAMDLDLYSHGWTPRVSAQQMKKLEESLTNHIQDNLPHRTIIAQYDDHYSILSKSFEEAGISKELISQLLPEKFLLVVGPGDVTGAVTQGEPLLSVLKDTEWKMDRGMMHMGEPAGNLNILVRPSTWDPSIEGLEAHAAARWYTDLLRNQSSIAQDVSINRHVNVFEHQNESILSATEIDKFEQNLRLQIKIMMETEVRKGVSLPEVSLFSDYEVDSALHKVAIASFNPISHPNSDNMSWSGILPVKTGLNVSPGLVSVKVGDQNMQLGVKQFQKQHSLEV